jgi:hypothetical protein
MKTHIRILVKVYNSDPFIGEARGIPPTYLLFGQREGPGVRRHSNPLGHLAVKSGLAISSVDVDCGCSAFQRMAAVMRVRPLG